MKSKDQWHEHLDNIFLIYFKAKIYLSESHLITSPKSYYEQFGLNLNANLDLDILFFIIKRSPGYNQLGSKSWILFVTEITKILSSGGSDKHSILKFYNKLANNQYKNNFNLECFDKIISLIKDDNDDSTIGRLRVLRDKYYAHSDENFNELTTELFPTFTEIWELMDKIEVFLKAMYSQNGSDLLLDIDNIISRYFLDFERMYRYYQVTEVIGDVYKIKSNFREERFNKFRNTKVGK